MDTENQKYCDKHAIPLTNNKYCDECNRDYRRKYLDENGTKWTTSEWLLKRVKYPSSNPELNFHMFYTCHNCKYFMHHQYVFCNLCGKKMDSIKTTYKEFLDKFSTYREGW